MAFELKLQRCSFENVNDNTVKNAAVLREREREREREERERESAQMHRGDTCMNGSTGNLLFGIIGLVSQFSGCIFKSPLLFVPLIVLPWIFNFISIHYITLHGMTYITLRYIPVHGIMLMKAKSNKSDVEEIHDRNKNMKWKYSSEEMKM
jgi:hypothetical protein